MSLFTLCQLTRKKGMLAPPRSHALPGASGRTLNLGPIEVFNGCDLSLRIVPFLTI
jgi:hypothetical protein